MPGSRAASSSGSPLRRSGSKGRSRREARPDGKVGHDAFAVIRETIREMDKVAIGRVSAAGAGEVDPKDYDLIGLAMQEPQYGSPGVRDLLRAIAKSRVPDRRRGAIRRRAMDGWIGRHRISHFVSKFKKRAGNNRDRTRFYVWVCGRDSLLEGLPSVTPLGRLWPPSLASTTAARPPSGAPFSRPDHPIGQTLSGYPRSKKSRGRLGQCPLRHEI